MGNTKLGIHLMRLEMTIYKTSHSFLSFNSYIWLKLYQMNNYILKSISNQWKS